MWSQNDTLYATSTLETWWKITRSKIFENYLITKRQTEKSINRRTKTLPWSNYGHLHSYGEHGVKYLFVRRPISAKPRLNFNLGFFIPLFKCIFGIMPCVLFRASKSHVIDKKNSAEFYFKAIRSEIRFHTSPGLS